MVWGAPPLSINFLNGESHPQQTIRRWKGNLTVSRFILLVFSYHLITEEHYFVAMSQLICHRPIVESPRTKGCDVFVVTFQQKLHQMTRERQ